MTASVTRSTVEGFQALIVQNQLIRATIIPELGGRIWELEDRNRGRQWIWHRDDVSLRSCPVGSNYDDVWAGGWEELFPNDAAGLFEGRNLPDHGEWWATPWTVEIARSGDEALVRMAATMSVLKARCIKEIRLRAGEPRLRISYRIRSLEPEPFHYLFKQHLPVSVHEDCHLMVPGGTVEPVDSRFGTLVSGTPPFPWPTAITPEGKVDLRIVSPPTAEEREFLYISGFRDGWCGIDDLRNRASLRMHFDMHAFPFLWLFLTYGGWRSLHTVVLEPCTNMPKDLERATALGQSALLLPGKDFQTEVVVALTGLEKPRHGQATEHEPD